MQQGRFARRHLIGIAAVSVVAIALPMSVYAQDGRSMTIGRADLKALNGSNASGQAELKLSADGKELTVIIQAKGLEPGGVHLSHIHGLSENGQSVEFDLSVERRGCGRRRLRRTGRGTGEIRPDPPLIS